MPLTDVSEADLEAMVSDAWRHRAPTRLAARLDQQQEAETHGDGG
jgi:hypothetical protein